MIEFKWSDLAFGSKKPVNELKATFIAAPRELSEARFKQLVKQYLPKGNIVLGLSTEQYVKGFEDQPHFKTLQKGTVQKTIDAVNNASPYKIYTLEYSQSEIQYILDKLKFTRIVLVNGSWLHAFHTRPEYYIIARKHIPYELVSPFSSEDEAKNAVINFTFEIPDGPLSAQQMLALAQESAKRSYDYMFQTGAVVGVKKGAGYQPIIATYNQVVPYETFALHHGASREVHFSPPNDLNHYDTTHAEIDIIIRAQRNGLSLKNTTLFINLMPCPTCARALALTDVAEIIYQIDHSNGYAVDLLQRAGKTITRVV